MATIFDLRLNKTIARPQMGEAEAEDGDTLIHEDGDTIDGEYI